MDQYWAQSPDGREFGPTDLPGVHRWIREGRVSRSTRVRRNDGAAIAAEFIAELSPLFKIYGAADTTPVPAAPTIPPTSTTISLPDTFGAWRFIGLAWDLVKPHWLILGLMSAIMVGIGAVPIVGGCAVFVLNGVFMIGYNRALLGLLAGRAPTVEMLFGGFDRFGAALLATIVVTILCGLGLVLLVVPGIIFALMWMFTNLVLADTTLDFADAMRRSAALTRGYRGKLFGLMLASLVVMLAGLLACGIGLFIAQPVTLMATALAYRFLQQQDARDQ